MTEKSAKTEKEELLAAYSEPLFVDIRPAYMEDMSSSTMKTTANNTGYHDRVSTLKIARGLCHDIFFRAGDENLKSYESIPEMDATVEESEKALPAQKSGKKVKKATPKPLDSWEGLNRTYILNPDEEEKKNAAPERPRRRKNTRRRSRGPRGPRGSKSPQASSGQGSGRPPRRRRKR